MERGQGGAQRGEQIGGGMEEDKGMKERKCRWVNYEPTGREIERRRDGRGRFQLRSEIILQIGGALTKSTGKVLMNEAVKKHAVTSPSLQRLRYLTPSFSDIRKMQLTEKTEPLSCSQPERLFSRDLLGIIAILWDVLTAGIAPF